MSYTISESLCLEEPLKKIQCTHTNDSELSFEVDIAGSTLQSITNSQFEPLLYDLNNELDSKDGFDELLVNFNVDMIENINPNTSNNVKNVKSVGSVQNTQNISSHMCK